MSGIQLVSTIEAAKILGISRRSLFSLTQGGMLPHFRILGSVRYSREDLADFIASRRIEGPDVKSKVLALRQSSQNSEVANEHR